MLVCSRLCSQALASLKGNSRAVAQRSERDLGVVEFNSVVPIDLGVGGCQGVTYLWSLVRAHVPAWSHLRLSRASRPARVDAHYGAGGHQRIRGSIP